jgi:hypothetical protein
VKAKGYTTAQPEVKNTKFSKLRNSFMKGRVHSVASSNILEPLLELPPLDWEFSGEEYHNTNNELNPAFTEFEARRMSTSGILGTSDHPLQNSVRRLQNWDQSPDQGTLQNMVDIMIDGKFSE